MANGRVGGGLFLLFGALVGALLAYVVTPFISTAIFGKMTEPVKAGDEAPPPGFVPRDYKLAPE